MISLAAIIAGFLLLTFIRSSWVQYEVERYELKLVHYITMNRLPDSVRDDMCALWPKGFQQWEWWNWDFRRYVVDHEHYDLMEEWFDSQLAREDLDYPTFRREVDRIEALEREELAAKITGSSPTP